MALLSSSPYSFTPTAGTTGTGSYNTQDWLSLLTGLGTGGLAGGASSAAINEQVARLRALGSSAAGDYSNLAQHVTQGTQFTPYTLTNALGTVQQTAPGVVSQTLTPQQQANVNAATAMQGGLYGQALPDTSGIQQQAFGQVGGYLSPTGNQQLQNLSGMFGNIAGTAAGQYGAPTGLEGTTAQALQGAAAGMSGIGAGLGDFNTQQATLAAQAAAAAKQYGAPTGLEATTNAALGYGLTGLQNVNQGLGGLQGLQDAYTRQAQAAAGTLGGSTQAMADQLFQTQQAMVTPEQQRQQLALENRLRAQGRLGTTTAMYGGTPEQLAMQKAIEEQRAGSAYGALTNAEQMAASQQARALGLGTAASGMATNISGLQTAAEQRALAAIQSGQQGRSLQDQLLSAQQQRELGFTNAAQQTAANREALTASQQQRALGLLTAGQQGTSLQEQLQASQLQQSMAAGQQASTLAAANQALKQGDVQTAASLFNIGSSAAQLPSQLRTQNIANAGQLQAQALAPSAQQLQQAQLAASMGQQNAAANLAAGTLFGNLVSTGMQEQLTAESAAAALRGKQYTSALSALGSSGGATGTAANAINSLISQGVRKVGDNLVNAANQVIGSVADVLGPTAASLWDSVGNIFDSNYQFEEDWQNAMAGNFTSDDTNAISDAWDTVKGWFS